LNLNQQIFIQLIREAKNVIGMDGYLDSTSTDLFHHIISNEMKSNEMIYVDINSYKPNKQKFILCELIENFFYLLSDKLFKGKKVYIPCESLNECDIIAEYMKDLYPYL
jgi:hypothetical protein